MGIPARSVDPLVEVRVVKIGSRKPARVRVRFVADEFEGLEEWVPPARLKVLWDAAEEFAEREKRWEAITSAYPIYDTAEYWAASTVFDLLIDPDLAGLAHRSPGVSAISDVDGLIRVLDLDADELRADPLSFEDGGDLVVPWPVTEMIARRAAERNPAPVLRHVERQEAKQQQGKVHGIRFRRTKHDDGYLTADQVAELDEEPIHRPCREMLRQWCGADVVEKRDEIRQLRAEVHRLGMLTLEATKVLREAGLNRDAARIERQLEQRG